MLIPHSKPCKKCQEIFFYIDPSVASQYLKQIRQQLNQIPPNSPGVSAEALPIYSTPGSSSSSVQPKDPLESSDSKLKGQTTCIWSSSKNQTSRDNDATMLFLELRKNMDDKFSDKKNNKNMLWTEIATKLNEMGYYVGQGVQGRDKCRQKFTNLQASYIKYKDKQKMTGQGKVVMPPFFHEIDEILGSKDKTNPVLVIDSLPESPQASSSQTNESSVKENRFKRVKASVVPNKNVVLEKLYSLGKENQEIRKEQFNSMMTFLDSESEKRHKETMALINSLSKNKTFKGKGKIRENISDSD